MQPSLSAKPTNKQTFNQSFGTVHPSLQQYDSHAHDVASLRAFLTKDPISNWDSTNRNVDPCNVTTWFPSDEHVAFYTPNTTLTYAQLQNEINACPPFQGKVVAVLLPPALMVEMAVVLLSIMARGGTAAPLDPHMTPIRVLEAMEQFQCQSIVSTEELLRRIHLWDDPPTTSHIDNRISCLSTVLDRLEEIRVIDVQQAGSVKWNIYLKQDEAPVSDSVSIRWVQATIANEQDNSQVVHLSSERPVLLLRTSGTTSTPKLLPLKAPMLLYNAICIAASLGLTRDDVDCNAMPFYHIGGIACALLAVLVSGSATLMAGPFLDPDAFLDLLVGSASEGAVLPTWYYGVPTMHKTLLLTATRLQREEEMTNNTLRFIRSGAAHLSHDVALDLSRLFHTKVLSTYSMSESMPVCSSNTPIDYYESSTRAVVDTVGYPIGPSVRIIDSDSGEALPYGSVGEVAICGPGVIETYLGDNASTNYHTEDGWLRTGDVGAMDRQGRIRLCGRTKEMIKRGGEQVWPNEIDAVVEKVDGVSTAVSFGVPNELWGEEVAVAVVLEESLRDQASNAHVSVYDKIMASCHEYLDDASIPRQIIFLESTDQLLKGSTGKYLRSQMSSHLNVDAVDTGALRALQSSMKATSAANAPPTPPRAAPSSALNGIRFMAACFVVMHHVGLYPTKGWLKVQSYTLNMTIFFTLAAFQLTCAIANSVKNEWAVFVGTKIGSMHALFVVTQFIALPAYLLFLCSDGCSSSELVPNLVLWFFGTATGIIPVNPANGVTWFQSVLYCFLLLFPCLDNLLRQQTRIIQGLMLGIFGAIATVAFAFLFAVPELGVLSYTILSWLPLLLAAMLAAYFFPPAVTRCRRRHISSVQNQSNDETGPDDKIEGARLWGVLTDIMSIVLLLFEVAVITSPDCFCMVQETFLEMRPNEALPGECLNDGETVYVGACGVTYDEFVDYIHPDPNDALNNGRWLTAIGGILGFLRLGTPVVLLWIFGLSFGRGLTACIMRNKVMAALAPLAYPIYLLHGPIARYYWVATRGLEHQFWFEKALLYPFPVQWYEFLLILGISLVLGLLIDRLLMPMLMPRTVKLGVKVCSAIIACCRCGEQRVVSAEATTFEQVEAMVKGLTGAEVTRSTDLHHLGLDSLGATALLSTLRANVAAAKDLTIQQLAEFRTVGELVEFLDRTTGDASLPTPPV